jgi:Zn-dependent protease
MDQLGTAIVWYAALLFSLTFHEAAHAWVARRGGDDTAYLGGQVSLDPRPHIRREPFGMLVFPLLSWALSHSMLGWASTPYDPGWAHAHPRRAAAMSAAGPAANLVLLLAAALAIRAGMAAGVFYAPEAVGFDHLVAATSDGFAASAALLLSVLFTLNLLLLVFNLIPFPPLDGASAVGLLFSEEGARRVQERLRSPQLAFVGLLLAWLAMRRIFGPIHRVAVNRCTPSTATAEAGAGRRAARHAAPGARSPGSFVPRRAPRGRGRDAARGRMRDRSPRRPR